MNFNDKTRDESENVHNVDTLRADDQVCSKF